MVDKQQEAGLYDWINKLIEKRSGNLNEQNNDVVRDAISSTIENYGNYWIENIVERLHSEPDYSNIVLDAKQLEQILHEEGAVSIWDIADRKTED